ncbi:unnamed protein product [Amoebophrya sp. A25]|nr:unnamed protein product [Amoebophrya sp. A25]|eukprot:GSA25T00001154001.1
MAASKAELRVYVSGLPDETALPAAELQNFVGDGLGFRPKSVFWTGKKMGMQLKSEDEVDRVVSYVDQQVYADAAGTRYTLRCERAHSPVNEGDLSTSVVIDAPTSEDEIRACLSENLRQKCAIRDASNKVLGGSSADKKDQSKWRVTFASGAVEQGFAQLQKEFGAQRVQLASVLPQMESNRAGRLIVRNLNFAAEEIHVRKAFQKFGKLKEVSLLKHKDTNKTRGIAFVEFLERNDANRALAEMNGQQICKRAVAVDFCVGKDIYTQVEACKRAAAKASTSSPTMDGEGKKGADGAPAEKDQKEKPVAKTKAAKKKKEDVVEDMSQDSSEEEEDSDSSDDEEKDGNGGKKEAESSSKGGAAVLNSEEDKRREVFVLNVPFDATKADIEAAFAQYGPVARVYLTPDHSGANSHRGSCFVKFVQESSVEKTLAEERRLQEKLREFGCKQAVGIGQGATATKLEGFGLVVKGRRLIVKRLETREDVAGKSKKSLKEQRQATRNQWSHLLKVGDLDETSPEFKALTKQEQNLRKQSLSEKKFKTKDPNYIINPKRLLVRNLELNMDAGALRNKLVEVIDAIDTASSAAGDEGAASNKVDDLPSSSTGESKKKKKNKDHKKASAASAFRLQPLSAIPKSRRKEVEQRIGGIRVMRSDDRKTADGVRRSLGYAFVEFDKHEDALRVLQRMNNSGPALALKRRLVVEFSFDDKRALRAQEQAKKRKEEAAAASKKRAAATQQYEGEQTGDEQKGKGKSKRRKVEQKTDGAEKDESKKLNRGARQRQRKRERREAQQGNTPTTTGPAAPGRKNGKNQAPGSSAKLVRKGADKNGPRRETVKEGKLAERQALLRAQRAKERIKHSQTDDLEEKYMRRMKG